MERVWGFFKRYVIVQLRCSSLNLRRKQESIQLFKALLRHTHIMESWFRQLRCGPANIPGPVVDH